MKQNVGPGIPRREIEATFGGHRYTLVVHGDIALVNVTPHTDDGIEYWCEQAAFWRSQLRYGMFNVVPQEWFRLGKLRRKFDAVLRSAGFTDCEHEQWKRRRAEFDECVRTHGVPDLPVEDDFGIKPLMTRKDERQAAFQVANGQAGRVRPPVASRRSDQDRNC